MPGTKFMLCLLLTCLHCIADAQTKPGYLDRYTPSPENLLQRQRFQDLRFGLFIHWGIYSLMANGEWVMHQQKIPYTSYKRLANFFDPEEFSVREWVTMAKGAGMKYITITSRHHDGFSMFNTAASDYNIVKATPYKKDPIRELAKECQKQGMELHFYYSLLDWGRSDYGFGKQIVNGAPDSTNWNSYIAFMKQQLTELISNYPNVRAIWFDGHWERPTVNWHYDEIYALIHKLNPAIMVGNNHHLAPIAGEDFQMFEKDLPGENKGGFSGTAQVGALPLETCETMNGSWGFNIKDNKYKSVKSLVHYLVNAAGRDANFLLNVGPMPNGRIQTEFTDTLAVLGKWMEVYGSSIYGTRGNLIPPQRWGVLTRNGKSIYVHILEPPGNSNLVVAGIKEKIVKVEMVKGGDKIDYQQNSGEILLRLRNISWDANDTVLRMFVE